MIDRRGYSAGQPGGSEYPNHPKNKKRIIFKKTLDKKKQVWYNKINKAKEDI